MNDKVEKKIGYRYLLPLLLFAPVHAQHYPTPPAPGYVYTIPYHGYPTYAGAGTSAATASGDVYCIQGSDNVVVAVSKIGVSATASSSGAVNAEIILRSSPDVGASNPVILAPYDRNFPVPNAIAVSYDSVPVPGTSIGTVRAAKLAVGTTGNATTIGDVLFRFDSPLLLRGPNEFACLNVSGVGTGASILFEHEHTELPH
jgi:hypothetical protein